MSKAPAAIATQITPALRGPRAHRPIPFQPHPGGTPMNANLSRLTSMITAVAVATVAMAMPATADAREPQTRPVVR